MRRARRRSRLRLRVLRAPLAFGGMYRCRIRGELLEMAGEAPAKVPVPSIGFALAWRDGGTSGFSQGGHEEKDQALTGVAA